MACEMRGFVNPSESMAVRVDPEAGIREEAEFFGSGRDRLFGLRYMPISDDATLGVVFCEPVLSQFRAHYRVGTLVARALANSGIAVQRFQYRGMGNSDGDVSDLTLSSMVEDTETATERLRDVTGSSQTAYVGVNVGAYPAAIASRSGAPLVLDSPPPTGRRYFRGAFRAHAVYAMKQEGPGAKVSESILEALRTSGTAPLLGCRLSRGFYESLVDEDLVTAIGEKPRPTLLIAVGRSESLRSDGEEIRDELTARGFAVVTEIRPKEDALWYVGIPAPEDRPDVEQMSTTLARWVPRQFSESTPGKRAGDG